MAQLTIQQAFDLALQHQQAGRWAEAEPIYRQILAHQPGHADALQMLGLLAYQMGHHAEGVVLIRQAIVHKPNYPVAYCNLGNILREMGSGHLEESVAACRQAIALVANFPEAYNNLGNTLKDLGRLDEAVAAYRQAITLRPGYPEGYNNLGNTLRDQGKLDEALATCRQAIALRPNFAEAYCNLGNVLSDREEFAAAREAYRQASTLRPALAEAHCNLGIVLLRDKQAGGRLEEAAAAFQQARALRPNYPEAITNYGSVLREQGKLAEAVAAYRQAMALQPDYASAHNNLGVVLQDQGQLAAADAAYRQAIELKPDYPDAQFNRALLQLLQGDYKAGWEAHEWRWQCALFRPHHWNIPQPMWDGSELTDRTIILHVEQGFGDIIQFIRFVPLVAARCGGGEVLVKCVPELRRLLQHTPGMTRWLEDAEPLPAFDVHCSFMSLPLALGSTLENLPREVPYLHAEAAEVEKWRRELAGDTQRLKVGVVWSGNPTHTNDRNRSMPREALAPLGQVPGVSFYSLQKGAADQPVGSAGLKLIDRTAELKDFVDTAALLANLDLVIAVDTAVAHLAGAMGKPVWTLLPFMPDWRWLLEREDSPWYTTMRLFRQTTRGDWEGVIQRVKVALERLVRGASEVRGE